MKIVKFICDRCKKEIERSNIYRVEIHASTTGDRLVDSSIDFCEECAKKIADFALERKIRMKQTKSTLGKSAPCGIAGWDIHKIADEMDVEDEEIEKIVRKH